MAGGSGFALAALGAGVIFVYSAIKGKTVLGSLQAVIQGKAPSTAPSGNAIPVAADIANAASAAAGSVTLGSGSGSSTAGTAVSGGSVQAILQQTAAQFGWGSGPEWQALQNVEMAEAGYNPTAKNSLGAYGIAQSLGHPQYGYPEYGGYGLTQAQVAAANNGDASAQALWMCRYIKSRWGDPIAAWANEQANHWY